MSGPQEPNIYDFLSKVKPENCVLVGVRDIDAIEKENVRRAGIGVFTMRDIDERGMRTATEEALRMAGRVLAGYHYFSRYGWIDPEDAPGVGTPVRGGATYRQPHPATEIIADDDDDGFEIVEVNPVIDEYNQTADLAVELALSAFEKDLKLMKNFGSEFFSAGAAESMKLHWLSADPSAGDRQDKYERCSDCITKDGRWSTAAAREMISGKLVLPKREHLREATRHHPTRGGAGSRRSRGSTARTGSSGERTRSL